MKKQYHNLASWEAASPTKAEFLDDLKAAINEVQLIKSGQQAAKSWTDLLDEL